MTDNSIIPQLRIQSTSLDPSERINAVETLNQFRESKTEAVAANIIATMIDDAVPKVREVAQRTLIEFGEVGIKILTKMLYCNDFDINYTTWKTAESLLAQSGTIAVSFLIETLENGDDCAKNSSMKLLIQMGDKSTINELSRFVSNRSPLSKLFNAYLEEHNRTTVPKSDTDAHESDLDNDMSTKNDPTRYTSTLL